MSAKGHWQNEMLRGALSTVLFLALFAPALGAKERRGAEIIITMKGGEFNGGELLAVKGLELVVLDTSTAVEYRYNLADIQTIDKVPKRSHWLAGTIIGVIAGVAVGAALAPTHRDPNEPDSLNKADMAVLGAVGYGLLGGAVGSMIKDTIKVKRTDPEYLAGIAAKLKGLAREKS